MERPDLNCPVRDAINETCPCPKADCDHHALCCQCLKAHQGRVDAPITKRLPFCLRDIVKDALG